MKLVRYVRDCDNKPLACVVALAANRVGTSICSKKDTFTKKRGKEIATQRAAENKQPVIGDRRKVLVPYLNFGTSRFYPIPNRGAVPVRLKDLIERCVVQVIERARQIEVDSCM